MVPCEFKIESEYFNIGTSENVFKTVNESAPFHTQTTGRARSQWAWVEEFLGNNVNHIAILCSVWYSLWGGGLSLGPHHHGPGCSSTTCTPCILAPNSHKIFDDV